MLDVSTRFMRLVMFPTLNISLPRFLVLLYGYPHRLAPASFRTSFILSRSTPISVLSAEKDSNAPDPICISIMATMGGIKSFQPHAVLIYCEPLPRL